MLKRFNEVISRIIFESLENKEEFSLNEDEILYKDCSIAIVPGSFKPPHRGHWEMVMHYVPLVDKVIVLISNISTKAISSRPLSMANLKKFGKIQEFIKSNDFNEDIQNEIEDLNSNIESLSFEKLNSGFDKIIENCKKNSSDSSTKLISLIENYRNDLNSKLFQSIRKAGDKEITPETSKEIFEIYANAYGVNDKVEVMVSSSASPITDTLNFVNHNCKNCKILLGVSKKGGDEARWNGISKSIKNPFVEVVPDPVEVQTQLSATDLRNNINNLKREWFPEKISDSDFEHIKELLQ